MGGNRAKERRRLKREGEAGNLDEGWTKAVDRKAAPRQERPMKTLNNRQQNQQRPPQKANRFKNDVSEESPFPRRPSSAPVVTTQSEKPQKKVKKPKHLKRKIEKLTDAEEKEVLRKSMEEWEKQKEAMRRLNKKPKKNHFLPKEQETNRDALPKAEEKPNASTPPRDAVDMGVPSITPAVDDKSGNVTAVAPVVNDNNDDGKESRVQQLAAATTTETDKPEEQARNLDDDDDDDSSVEDVNKNSQRQRGKRRRGRKDTSKKVGESNAVVDPTPDTSQKVVEDTTADIAEEGAAAETTTEPNKDEKKSKKQTDRSRYCVGRKPVTDYIVGQTYDGKVVYVKPFGVFLDIGCHSDAFCHISRVRDDFVKDPTALFNEGDSVQARVVEIDRRQKRITVSMQSKEMIEMERKSIETRKERTQKRSKKQKKAFVGSPKTSAPREAVPVSDTMKKSPEAADQNKVRPLETQPKIPKDPAAQSHAELKRQRKLARRAERRTQQGIPETDAANSQ